MPRTLPRRTLAARGMTFLEVVAAVALLALVTITFTSAFNFIFTEQRRERRRLAAAELANRLVLQYLDDPATLPPPGAPLEFAGDRYEWGVSESRALLTEAVPPPEAARTRTIGFDRLKVVSVSVWLAEESGGSTEPAPATPAARVVRVLDPIVVRNPDTLARRIESDAGIAGFVSELLGTSGAIDIGSRTGGSK